MSNDPVNFVPELWRQEIQRAYINATLYGRGFYRLPPLTRWQRIKRFLKFYEARYRVRIAWECLRYGGVQ